MKVESDVRPEGTDEKVRIPAPALWFAVLGGVVAWTVQLLVDWSFEEVSCIGGGPGAVLQHDAGPSVTTSTIVYVVTGVAWAVAVLALVTALVLRARVKRFAGDVLAEERVKLMLVLAMFLDVMTIAIILGGGIALLVLEPCT